MRKLLCNYEDVIELLAECAISTENVKAIEEFFDRRKQIDAYRVQRLKNAEMMLGSNLLDDMEQYE